MLEVYCGNDNENVRQYAFLKVAELKQEGVDVTVLDVDSYVPGLIHDAVEAQSLFGGKVAFVIDTPSADDAFAEEVSQCLEAMAASTHAFIVLETALLAPVKKAYAKHGKVEEYKKANVATFNTFSLADALAGKNKKQLWMLLQEARLAGESAEAIIGILWWQLKSLRLAQCTKNADEAGMKEYPYNKAKRSLGKFAPGELEAHAMSLLTVYHEGHRGLVDIDDALEMWVLNI